MLKRRKEIQVQDKILLGELSCIYISINRNIQIRRSRIQRSKIRRLKIQRLKIRRSKIRRCIFSGDHAALYGDDAALAVRRLATCGVFAASGMQRILDGSPKIL